MVYRTYSLISPSSSSGSASSDEIHQVHNNPLDEDSVSIYWPNKYDSFVQKNNAFIEAFTVTDEIHDYSKVATGDGNSLTLHHKIVPPEDSSSPTTIAVSASDYSVTYSIATGLTDYEAGKIYLSTVPLSGSLIVSYLAQPDAIHSQHLNVLQDSIMKLETVLGAGTDVNDGIKNLRYLLFGTAPTGAVLGYAPNAVPVAEFTETGLLIAGESGYEHTITLGNSYDVVKINAKEFIVQSTGGYEATTGSYPYPASGNQKISVYADSHFRGQATFGEDWPNRALGSWSTSGEYTGAAARFMGDVFVNGNLVTTGALVTVSTNVYHTGNQYTQDLTVSGDLTVEGDTTLNGNLTVGGSTSINTLTVSNELFVGNRISFTNPNGNVTTVDGLDPSYINDHLSYMNRDPLVNGVISCNWDPIQFTEWYDPQGSTNFTGSRTRTWTGAVTAKRSTTSGNWLDTDLPVFYYPAGIYEESAFDGELILRWLDGPVQGKESTVLKMFNSIDAQFHSDGSSYRLVNDSHYTNAQIGNRFELFLPGNQHCKPKFIDAPTLPVSDPVITISATNANPLVINVGGQIRRISQSSIPVNMTAVTSDTSTMPATGTVKVYIYTRSVGSLYQSYSNGAPAFYARPYYVSLPEEIIIGEVTLERSGGAWANPSNWTVTHYAPDAYWDSGWIFSYLGIGSGRPTTHGIDYESSISNWGNGHLKQGFNAFNFDSNKTQSRHIILNHNLGDERKIKHSKLTVYIATTYWNDTADTLSDTKNDLESNTLKRYIYRLEDPDIIHADRNTMTVAFDTPQRLQNAWNSSTWSEYIEPTASNDVRAYVRFVIRPVRQGILR